MIRVVVPVQVKKNKKSEFLSVAQGLIQESRKEKGCIEYNLIDSNVDNELYFIEKWETKEDLNNHAQSTHSKKYGELLKGLKETESPIEIYEINKKNNILERRSIRNYTSQNVSKEIVDRIIEAGMYAPSAGNQQGWEFVVIRNREVLDKLSKMSPYATPLKKANIAILILGNENVKYPQNLFQDLGAATQNILLQITTEGLGGVWLGIAPEADRMDLVKSTLDLKENILPFAIVPFGYSSEEEKTVNRYDKSKVWSIE
ncbi:MULTISPECIES: nitroreductase family protein [Cetobacterium]|uniref:Nitroreductase family protein n=1 Tax=Candidatus Cetobacterium colombiensis TaxID=3073100 RepID=A0ABU4WC93_9FUSO|nr:nitroreductase family protein [Candidatus Cetobacterium colombiensis]MDX8337126.1 nitroreductase family protein [Candidatus Cetobacterium colombiensis]